MSAPETSHPAGGDSASWAVAVPIGYRVGGWEVLAPIATGNFGSVYAATDGDGTHALKFLATGATSPRQSRRARELAEREASFSRNAPHDRLMTVRETFIVDDPDVDFDGAVVLVMPLAAASLQDLIDRQPDGAAVPGAGRMVGQICEGLAHLHRSGWVHGDLKPSNVLVMPDGSARLADFGLASRLDGTHGYGLPLGSTDYLPPERVQDGLNERGVRVRPTTDVWALGVTAHQLATGGAFPMPGATPGARMTAAQEFAAGRAALRLSNDLDEGWREFVALCLAPDHETRAAVDVDALVDRAHRLTEPGAAPPSRSGRARWIAGLAALALLLVAAGAGALWWWRDRTPPAAPTLSVRVYNVEASCQSDRGYSCSLGLALDPRKPYAAGNVSPRRVWHGDALVADCVIFDGTRVADEYGVGSTRWFRVAVPDGHAWLPGVRTKDTADTLPACPG